LIAATTAGAVTLYGILERRRAFDAEQAWRKASGDAEATERERAFETQQAEITRRHEQWSRELEAARSRGEVDLRKEFLLEQYKHRLDSYPSVMTILGAVSDVELRRAPERFQALYEDPAVLSSTAAQLRDHLFGEAGLLMTMETRGRLHGAVEACSTFLERGPGARENDDLTDAFFWARRYLRADLELLDDRSADSLRTLVGVLSGEQPPAPSATSDQLRHPSQGAGDPG
jgi:hypothetical protein